MAVEYAILDDERAQAMLKKLEKKVLAVEKRNSDYIALISALVYRDIIEHFEDEKGSKGPWKKWSQVYDEHMKAIGKGGNKILQDTGMLRQSIIPIQSGGNNRRVTDGILWFNPAKTKTGFPYAYAHNEGGEILKKRDFMWLSKEAREKIAKQTLQFLEDL